MCMLKLASPRTHASMLMESILQLELVEITSLAKDLKFEEHLWRRKVENET